MTYDVWIVDNDSLTLSSSDLSSESAELVLSLISLDSLLSCYPVIAPSSMRLVLSRLERPFLQPANSSLLSEANQAEQAAS